MDKNKLSRGIFDGWLALAFLFLLVSSILALSLSGFCAEDWVVKNLVTSFIFEILIFIWMIVHVRRGVNRILKETKNLYLVRDLYIRILYVSLIGVALGVVAFLLSLKVPIEANVIYPLNIMVFSLIFAIWMWIAIYRLNRHLRFWFQKALFKIGYVFH